MEGCGGLFGITSTNSGRTEDVKDAAGNSTVCRLEHGAFIDDLPSIITHENHGDFPYVKLPEGIPCSDAWH